MNASWYGPGFEGATTANGEAFDPSGFTAAHKTLPFGTTLEVCYQGCVNVRINDRGPFIAGRDLDLSEGAADAIGLKAAGHAPVTVTYTDGSTPAGPSAGGEAPTVQQPAQDQPAQDQPQQATQIQQDEIQQDEIQQQDEVGAVDAQYVVDEQYEDTTVVDEQYDGSAAGEQYLVEEQYSQPQTTSQAPVAEAVAPLAPETAQLEVAPLELATPGSTVERRIQLAVAAPPENYTGPLPEASPVETSFAGQSSVGHETPASQETSETPDAPDADYEPESGSVAAVAGLTVLPDTGGLPVAPLAGAALVLSLMVFGVRAFRR